MKSFLYKVGMGILGAVAGILFLLMCFFWYLLVSEAWFR